MTTKEDLLLSSGVAPASEHAKRLSKDFDLATQALKEGSCQELYVLWERAIKDQGTLLQTVDLMFRHYQSGPRPLYQPPSDSVSSMERVALAAIDLAKQIAGKAKNGRVK